jgi:hypothetical protein
MTDNIILEAIRDTLIENVASKIKLQVPFDDDINKYELMHPNVFIGWLPPPNQLQDIPQQLLDGVKKAIPCMIVTFDTGEDDGNDAGLDIRISFAVYNPGLYEPSGEFTPTSKGYQDLVNLIFLARQELSSNPIISNGKTEANKPFKWGMYLDQPQPYWFGYLTFRATAAILAPKTNQVSLDF